MIVADRKGVPEIRDMVKDQGRGLLAEPNWTAKARAGADAEIVKCLACNECFGELFKGNPIACPQNPQLCQEGGSPEHA